MGSPSWCHRPTRLEGMPSVDAAEDVIVRFIDHDMHHYPQGKGSKNSTGRRLLPRSEWRFEADSSGVTTVHTTVKRWQHQLAEEGGVPLLPLLLAVDAMARGEQDGCARRVCSP